MHHSHPESLVQELAERARQIRLDVLDMSLDFWGMASRLE